MRKYRNVPALLLLAVSTSHLNVAQQAGGQTVNVGTVVRVSRGSSASDIKGSQEFLDTLELQFATHVSKLTEVAYLDREHLDAVFAEFHLSSASAFDASTGALRGMLGRLDILIVAESSSPTLARVRILDIETGSVKGTAVCEAKTSFFGGLSNSDADCVAGLTQQMLPIAKGRLRVNSERAVKAEAALQAVIARQNREEARATEEERAREHQRSVQAELSTRVRLAALQQQQLEMQLREEQIAAAAQRQTNTDAQLEQIRPTYDDAMAKLSAAVDFWNEIERSSGVRLRPEISSVLRGAQAIASRCHTRFSTGDPQGAATCVRDLIGKLNRLDELK